MSGLEQLVAGFRNKPALSHSSNKGLLWFCQQDLMRLFKKKRQAFFLENPPSGGLSKSLILINQFAVGEPANLRFAAFQRGRLGKTTARNDIR